MKQHNEALAALDRALELEPESAGGWLAKAHSLLILGRPAEALSCADHAIAADVTEPHAWQIKSTALRGVRRWADALPSAEKAVTLAPDDQLCLAELAQALAANGQTAAARDTWTRALQAGDGAREVWLVVVKASMRGARYDMVLALCEPALAVDPDDAAARAYQGDALRLTGRHKDAVGAYERLVRVKPDMAAGWRYLGICLERRRRRNEATAAWERAAALDPTFKAPRGLGRLQLRLGL